MSGYRFKGRTAIITGGGGDIGGAVAQALYNRGMNIVIADKNPIAAEFVANELGERAIAAVGDLTDETAMARILAESKARFGTLDVLINGIAVTLAERFHSRSVDSIRRETEINFVAPLVMTRLAVPYLQESDDPRVITTTSLGGIQPLRETPIYSATKFGLRGAMMSFALDRELHGITVSIVAPTATDTQMLREEALSDGNVLNFIDAPQSPEDVARTFIKVLKKPRLEIYPKTSDSLLARISMLIPNLQPRLLPYFERLGRKGMKRYVDSLQAKGLIEEADGGLRLCERVGRDI